jgi:hypothetical protein
MHFKQFVAMALISVACLGESICAAEATPHSIEQVFWQSAEKIGTLDAYKAYLSRYPTGFFAPIAMAAIGKYAEAVKPGGLTAEVAVLQQGSSLSHFSTASLSGTVEFNIGDSFSGPTALGVGRLGAKKKLVLPSGNWVALAAQDESANIQIVTSFTNTVRLTLTTATFGRFAGSSLVSLMTFRFSAQKVTASG